MDLKWNRYKEKAAILVSLGFLAMLQSCNDSGGNNDGNGSGPAGTASIEPIEANIKTSVSLAYGASIAMASVGGSAVPNASVSNTCSSYPCLATVAVTLFSGDLPFDLNGYDEMFIAGLWASEDEAVLTTSFNGLRIGSPNNLVLSISTFPVVRQGDRLVVSYGGIDIDVASEPLDTVVLSGPEIQQELGRIDTPVSDDPEVNVNMDAWVIVVESNGTVDSGDDDYSVTGGGQYIGVSSIRTSVIQLGLVDMRMSADCTLNPVSGMAVLNELDVTLGGSATYPRLGTATFQFQPDCDGTARILAAIGSYGIIVGDDVNLHL